MATVTASNGIAYYIWPFADLTAPEPVDEIDYPTIDNTLTDGYRAGILCGAAAGMRSWKFTFPSLMGTLTGGVLTPTMIDINGATVTREQALRALFVENKVTGQPFVYQDPQSGGTNYFVDFADEMLTMVRMRVKIYTSGVEIRQRRLMGVTLP